MEPGTYFHCQPSSSREAYPDPKRMYIVCKDGSIQDVLDPERSIGWKIVTRGTVSPAPESQNAQMNEEDDLSSPDKTALFKAVSENKNVLFKAISAIVITPLAYAFITEYPLFSAFAISVNYIKV
jgi:enterochelin esterase-like enzyme